jgi:Tfp pilus assembly protein PilP
MRKSLVLLLVALSIPAAINAQTPAKVPPTPATGATPLDNYIYESGGRRDPFVNLIGTGTELKGPAPKAAEGAAGLTVSEISVRGVMQGRSGLVVMVQGADKKTYLVHQGDKFADGTVKSVSTQGLVIVQEVNDPLSLIKQREIRKQLRSAEVAKP